MRHKGEQDRLFAVGSLYLIGEIEARLSAETHKEEDAMLDFEEEITRFKPSMEVGEVEEAIVREDLTDMTDLMVEFLKNGTEQSGKE